MVHCKKCKLKLQPKMHNLIVHAKSNKHLLHELREKNDDGIRNEKEQKRQTEARLALYQALHNNMNASNHLLDVLKSINNTSAGCSLRRTKCTSLTVNVLAPIFRKFIISDMFLKQCSFYLDESTDISGCSFLGK